MDNSLTSELFVGRSLEIKHLLSLIINNDTKTITIIGEPGIGKSSYLKEVVLQMQNYDQCCVGFHQVLFSADIANPFVGVLEGLLENLSQKGQEDSTVVIKKIRDAIETATKKRINRVAIALAKDALTKILGDNMVNELGQLKQEFDQLPNVFSLTSQFIAEHKSEFVYGFLDLVNSIQKQFPEKKFVLIIDQFERAPLNSWNIFFDIANAQLKNLHVIISLSLEESSFKKLQNLMPQIQRIGSEVIELPSLEISEIAEWMEKLGKKFNNSNLVEIKRLSAGVPFTLSEWIKSSSQLDLKQLSEVRGRYCEFIKWRLESLEPDYRQFICKLAVLQRPLTVEEYEKLANVETATCGLYLKKLENALILSKQGETLWFRHDLIRFCIEGFLNSNEKKYYHSEADKFFEKKIGLLDKTSELKFQTLTACAYHSHHAQNSDSSLFYNRALFYLSFAWGMFDYSETSALLGIAAAKSLGNTKDEIKFRTGLSRVYHTWGRIEDALSILRENLNQSQRIGDFEEQSIITQDIAIIEERRGNYNEAIRLFETCIEIEKTHKKQTSASVLYHLALIENFKGNYNDALQLFNGCLSRAKQENDPWGIANIYQGIATIYVAWGEYDKSLEIYKRVLAIREGLRDLLGISNVTHQVGILEYSQQHYYSALICFRKSLRISMQIGNPSGAAGSLYHISLIFIELGNYEKALRLLKRCHKIATRLDEQAGVSRALLSIASILYKLDNLEEAEKLSAKGFSIATRLGERHTMAVGFYTMGIIQEKLNNLALAALNFSCAISICQELKSTDLKKAEIGFDRVMNRVKAIQSG